MKYRSRSDFMFNIREFAESLRIQDMRALNDGFGLGEIKKAEVKPFAVKESAAEQVVSVAMTIPARGVNGISSTSRPGASHPTAPSHLPERRREQRLNPRPPGRGHVLLKRLLALGLGHFADITILFAMMTTFFLLFKRISLAMNWEIAQSLNHYVQMVASLLLHERLLVVGGALYLLFIIYWLSFKIVGLRTLGMMLSSSNKKTSQLTVTDR